MRPERGSSPVMGLISASSLDRNEPSLAPEWLKGVGHASSFPLNQGNQRYSSRYKAPSERISERDTNNFRSYSNFGRRFDEREPGRDWDWSRDRRLGGEKERFYSGSGYFEDKDRDRGFGLYRSPVPRPDFERRQSEIVEKKFGSSASRVERTFPASDGQFAPKPTPPPRIPWKKNEAEVPSTQGVGSRDKLKPKATDVLASRSVNGYGYRHAGNASSLGESTSGRLLVLKASKEAATLARPSIPHPPSGKQLVDRRAVPIPADNSNSSRPKNGLAFQEEKKPAVCGQNRSDFFNAIRKKAAANGEHRNTVEKGRPVETGGEKPEEVKQSSPDGPKPEDKVDEGDFQARFFAIVGGSEEEETALLRSLGWEEGDEDAALTAEEINAFIQEHMRCLTSSPSILNRQSQRLRNAILDLSAGERQGNASSGSDSEDEVRS